MSYNQFLALWEQYIIYLRKSRQDDPRETVEEVLAKHEAMLQEYALREFGHKIPEENIYREVVSGESIESRDEMKKVLARIEDPNIKGVLVVEPSRLSRGDLLDCGRLINDLRYTKTLVVTPMMTYDIENKMERKFFQDELLRSSDFLEYTKEVLWRGRVAAIKRGCYIGSIPPYGYKKIMIGKDHTLEIIPEEAAVVRQIFEWYISGITLLNVARKLNEMGVKSQTGGKWTKSTLRGLIVNEHYLGFVLYNTRVNTVCIENGERIVRSLKQDEDKIIKAKGLHEAIIDQATWDAARAVCPFVPRNKRVYPVKNPFATVLVCANCGKTMSRTRYDHAEDRLSCLKEKCYKSVKISDMVNAVIMAIEEVELPAMELKVTNNEGNSYNIQKKLLEKLERQMEDYEAQEEAQYELLENRQYTPEVFAKRNAALREKMNACQDEIKKARASMPKSVDYKSVVKSLQDVVEILKDKEASPEVQNKIVKSIISRIEYTGAPRFVGDAKNGRGNNSINLKVFLRV
jgi:DNA invertase Pin-like site-specific DNA recombinase